MGMLVGDGDYSEMDELINIARAMRDDGSSDEYIEEWLQDGYNATSEQAYEARCASYEDD